MSVDTIEKLLDRHAYLAGEHAVLHQEGEDAGANCSVDLKKRKLQKKDDMRLIEARLAAFPPNELRQARDDCQRRLNVCSAGNRRQANSGVCERLEAACALLEAAIESAPEPQLVHSSEPVSVRTPAPDRQEYRVSAATG